MHDCNGPRLCGPDSHEGHTQHTLLRTVRFRDSCNRRRFPTACSAHCSTVLLLVLHFLLCFSLTHHSRISHLHTFTTLLPYICNFLGLFTCTYIRLEFLSFMIYFLLANFMLGNELMGKIIYLKTIQIITSYLSIFPNKFLFDCHYRDL